MVVNCINANSGQDIIITVQVLDGYGERIDGYVPQVDWILNPSSVAASGYPQNMTRMTTGVYSHSISIGSGSSYLGTYTISCSWTSPSTGFTQYEIFLIHVQIPYGNSSVFPA